MSALLAAPILPNCDGELRTAATLSRSPQDSPDLVKAWSRIAETEACARHLHPSCTATIARIGRLVDDYIDLEPLLRDAVVLALPLAPVCREDCPGLCPDCGARLADVEPGHGHEQVDPRWAALRVVGTTEQHRTPEQHRTTEGQRITDEQES